MAIAEMPLSFASLEELDNGKIGKVLKQHLARIASDCYDRPGDDSDRTVSVSFKVKPILGDDGNCETTKVQIACQSKVPVHKTKPYEMRITPNGLAYNADSPSSFPQHTIPFED